MNEQLTWRQGAAEDTPLLLALFRSTKGEELAPLGFTPEQFEPLLQMQFKARQMSYGGAFPNALDMVLCLQDGTAVGRHLIDRQPDCYRSIDLAVLPEYRNRGIGTWALELVQKLATAEGVAVRLRVIERDRAVHLYERMGFEKIASDEISFEMEWRPATIAPRKPAPPKPESRVALLDGTELDRSSVVEAIFAFLRGIGLTVNLRPVPEGFLPGIRLVSNGLDVDLDRMLYPGDLLHEAGHLAVMPPGRRSGHAPASTTDGGEEMAALAWSYAAIVNLGLPPEVVFHEHGYKGQSRFLIDRYREASSYTPGLPLLVWMQLTETPSADRSTGFPRMLRWLRPQPVEHEPTIEEMHVFDSPIPESRPAGLEQVEEVHA